MGYRNKTYIAFDGDNDMHYYRLMTAWKASSSKQCALVRVFFPIWSSKMSVGDRLHGHSPLAHDRHRLSQTLCQQGVQVFVRRLGRILQ